VMRTQAGVTNGLGEDPAGRNGVLEGVVVLELDSKVVGQHLEAARALLVAVRPGATYHVDRVEPRARKRLKACVGVRLGDRVPVANAGEAATEAAARAKRPLPAPAPLGAPASFWLSSPCTCCWTYPTSHPGSTRLE